MVIVNKPNLDMHRNLYTVAVHLVPSVGSQLGGTPVQVRGPCFNPNDRVRCFFGPIPTPGIYESQDSVFCVTPILFKQGRIQVRVEITNSNGVRKFSTYFTSGKYCAYTCKKVKDIL